MAAACLQEQRSSCSFWTCKEWAIATWTLLPCVPILISYRYAASSSNLCFIKYRVFPPLLHQWSWNCGRQCLAPIYFHQFSTICWHFAWCVILSKVKNEGPRMTVHAPVTFAITLSIPQCIDSAPPCGIRPSFANIQCHQHCTRWDLMIIRPWHWSGNLVGGQAYYPERLAKAFVVHVPTIFWGVWHMLSPFIDKVTREKVGFLFMPDKQIFSAELWI